MKNLGTVDTKKRLELNGINYIVSSLKHYYKVEQI